MKTGCTSGKKNFVFTFHSVCTVFVPFKIGSFQVILSIRQLQYYKRLPYGKWAFQRLIINAIAYQRLTLCINICVLTE